MTRTHTAGRLAFAATCAVVLVGCGGSSDSAGSSDSSSAATSSAASGSTAESGSAESGSAAATISIHDFAFETPDSVSPGATITVDNQDGTEHTVTADTGDAFDDAARAGTSTFTAPTEPGSYPFHCEIHPQMHGTLVVG